MSKKEYHVRVKDDNDNIIFETCSFKKRDYHIEIEEVEVNAL